MNRRGFIKSGMASAAFCAGCRTMFGTRKPVALQLWSIHDIMWKEDPAKTFAKIRETDKTPGNKLTQDGVHMAFRGNCMMAECLLKTMGVDEKTMTSVRTAWRHVRGAAVAYLPLTEAEFEFIDADEGTFDEALQRRFIKMIEAEMKQR